MPDRYTALLDIAYTGYLNTGIVFPAGKLGAKPVVQGAQRAKVKKMLEGALSLKSTLADCGQVMSKAQSHEYATNLEFKQDAQKYIRLLAVQVQALAALLTSFDRDYTVWVQRGPTMDWGIRKKAVEAQKMVDVKFSDAVAQIQSEVDKDITAVSSTWPDEPILPAKNYDFTAQREALMDASLYGVPLVLIDPSLRANS